MITPLADFPHNQIIKEAKINILDLDLTLRTAMTDFNSRHAAYLKQKNEAMTERLMAVSTIISQNIYDYYVDKGDQDVVITPDLTKKEIKEVAKDIKDAEAESIIAEPVIIPAVEPIVKKDAEPVVAPVIVPDSLPTNPNELALYKLHKEGITEGISRAKLKEYGFDTSSWGPLGTNGCKVGGYRIYKEFSEHVFKLAKI